MEKINILGVELDNLSLQEVLEEIKRMLASGQQHYIVTPNPEFIVAANNNPQFAEILNYADIAVADGIGLVYAAKFLGQRLQRVTGVDLMAQICELAEQINCSIYLLGGEELVAAETAAEIKKYHPNLRLAGAESGGEILDPKTLDQDLIDRINDAAPDILFVAFGQVKQEAWIFYHLDRLPTVKLAVGVGGAFDFISGRVSRAPGIIRQFGLEWLYRLIREPKRLPRIMRAIFVFPALIIKAKYFSGLKK